MNINRGVCFALLAVALAGQMLWAGNILGTSGRNFVPTTTPPGQAASLAVFGDWIETIDRATTSAGGVTVTIERKQNGAQNNTGQFKGRGRVDLVISTRNASPGEKTIKLSGGIYGESAIKINVLPDPTITDVSIPTPSEPFKEIVVTFMGSGLQGAIDPAVGKIVRDNLVNYITAGGDVVVSSVRVLNSANSNLQAKIFFNGFVQDVSVDLDFRAQFNNAVPLIGGLRRRVRLKSSNIRNFVKSITFPNGSTFNKNSVATIRLNLMFPAPSDGATAITIGGRTVSGNFSLAGNANRKVWFKFVPMDAFAQAQGGTTLNTRGLSTALANPGDDAITLTVKVVDCLGGQPGTVNTVKIQTWMHSSNTNQGPEFVEQSFGVRCTQ